MSRDPPIVADPSSSPPPSEAIPAGLYLLQVDAQGRPAFRFVTERLLIMLDLPREQFLTNPGTLLQRVHPDDYPAFLELNRQVFVAPQSFLWEGRVLIRGVTRWWRLESSPRALPEGGTLWEGAAIDITDAKMAEAAGRTGEARFQHLLHFAPVPLGHLDRAHRTRFYNVEFTRTYGYSESDLPDEQRWWELAYPDPADRRQIRQRWDAALAALAAGDRSQMPFQAGVRCKNSTQRAVEIHYAVLDDGYLGAFVDVTERRQAQQHEREVQTILRAILNDQPLAVIAERIVRAIEAAAPEALCSLLLVDEDSQQLRLLAAPSLPAFYNTAIDGLAIGDGQGACGTAAALGERVFTEDIQVDPAWTPYRELAAQAGLRACWSEPVVAKDGEVLAAFAVYAREARTPSAWEIERIEGAASLAGLAIERARAREDLAWRTACRDAVHEIFRMFLTMNESDLDAAINVALARIGTCVCAHRCYLFQMNEDGAAMTCTHEWCAPGIRPQIDELRDLDVDRYPWLPEIANSRQPAWVTQDNIAQLSPDEQKMMRDGEIQSMLAIPMFRTGQMCSILGLDNIQVRKRWSGFEQGVMRMVADIISAALVRNQLLRALRTQAYQDELTGLPNRRAFDEGLRDEIRRARRYHQVFSLLLLDIDRFKAINDAQCHDVGDQTLRMLGAILSQRMRETDRLARWGGEEFALLLPNTGAEDARLFAEQLRVEECRRARDTFWDSKSPK
ncbi:MAG: diguanylate cyclase domain-containing protein, partial [Halochromatium sp.]|uniref:diguanylate cyclase domain-containing protein n=1 Tax=Halochromatium sp. TaxID=2049430 RepID=UPI00397AEB9D